MGSEMCIRDSRISSKVVRSSIRAGTAPKGGGVHSPGMTTSHCPCSSRRPTHAQCVGSRHRQHRHLGASLQVSDPIRAPPTSSDTRNGAGTATRTATTTRPTTTYRYGVSARSRRSQGLEREPPSGFEPETYALRVPGNSFAGLRRPSFRAPGHGFRWSAKDSEAARTATTSARVDAPESRQLLQACWSPRGRVGRPGD